MTTMAMPPLDAVVDDAVALFNAAFPSVAASAPRDALTIAAAPGRVNLIGEHTDYNDGFVLPLALDKYTVVVGVAAPAGETHSRVASTKFDGVLSFAADASLRPSGSRSWGNYVQGVTAMYVPHHTAPLAVYAAVASSVPLGSGLSSSAALEVAFATFLEAVFQLSVAPQQKALLCQRAEHEFCGVPCGIMDQFISTFGQRGAALLLDCRSQQPTPVPFADPDVVVVVCNSNVQHELSGSEYRDRVAQCREAVAALQTRFPGVTHLRDATLAQLDSVLADGVVYRRARHVISENDRTTQAMALITAHRYEEAGKLMYASHASLRDDYEVSTPQLDELVERARAVPGVYGARMTGGGFGGCIVALVPRQHAPALLQALDAAYPPHIAPPGQRAEPPRPASFITSIGAGAHVVQAGRR
ncbi:hypothetical protein P43SY_004606 [Pythium insidiosum]|uniref:Galactokinase n=1 Tax=Pythium insidiosum TaxID=114742 RepID=A0AAD5LII7_PYTIN|nr:hypothetical protein P43SY_004606 [Pythium insidiosum]